MSKGLESLKRLAYENACCRCQYYIHKKCTNKHECIWLDIEKELKEKEQQDSVLKILKEIIQFSRMLPQIKPNNENGFDLMSAVKIDMQRDIENKERELLRNWVLETCFPKELKALEIIKDYINVDKDENGLYWINLVGFGSIGITQEKYDLLKEVLK